MILEFTSLTSFTKIFTGTVNKHAPIKKNILAQTTQVLLQKDYSAIMLDFRIFSEKKLTECLKRLYLRNICVKMVKKSKERTLLKH